MTPILSLELFDNKIDLLITKLYVPFIIVAHFFICAEKCGMFYHGSGNISTPYPLFASRLW